MSYELGLNYYELLKAETDVKISASALVSTPILYRDDNRYIWEYEELDWISEGNDYVPVSQRQVSVMSILWRCITSLMLKPLVMMHKKFGL